METSGRGGQPDVSDEPESAMTHLHAPETAWLRGQRDGQPSGIAAFNQAEADYFSRLLRLRNSNIHGAGINERDVEQDTFYRENFSESRLNEDPLEGEEHI